MSELLDFWAPDGLELTDDDATRKFSNSYIEVCEVDTDKRSVALVISLNDGTLCVYHDAHKSKTYTRDAIKIARIYPDVSLAQYGDAIIRGTRTGVRQWQLGLNTGGYDITVVGKATTNIRLGEVKFAHANALFYPKYTSLDAALALLNDHTLVAAALSPKFWVYRREGRKGKSYILYRESIPVGVFTSPSAKSFYFQEGCEVFRSHVLSFLESQ